METGTIFCNLKSKVEVQGFLAELTSIRTVGSTYGVYGSPLEALKIKLKFKSERIPLFSGTKKLRFTAKLWL